MHTITPRSYAGEADLLPIVELLNACEAVDQDDQYYSVNDLRVAYGEPGFDPTQNIQLWHDETGCLVAYADLWTPSEPTEQLDGFFWFRVRPAYRWQGIEDEIFTWAETRFRAALANHPGRNLPRKLYIGCRSHQLERIQFYEQNSFAYERCFITMSRSLALPVAESTLPDGFQIIQAQGDEDVEKWVEMYNQTFVDHWNFHPETVEERRYWLSTPKYCPQLDLVALSPENCFAAFCSAHIDAEENQQRQRQEGWINRLGTRRGFRRVGLARAMLLAGLRALQAAGMETAKLAVDTENPNSAQQLYESVGFQKLHASLSYAKRID